MAFGFAVALLTLPAAASAQLFTPDAEFIARASAIARENLTAARLPDGRPMPAETAEELARPIVPAELDAQTVRRGSLSGDMEACGLDWMAGSFEPYMARLRATARYTDKQLAYVGLLHGFSQGVAYQVLRPHVRGCTAAMQRQLLQAASSQLELPLP